jgi:hypothetical protein
MREANMLEKMKESFRALSKGAPGRRFTDHHEERQRQEGEQGAGKTALYTGVGVALLVVGALLSIPPGVPGFLLWLPGLGLLVARFKALAVVLDRAEMFFRRLFRMRRSSS